MSKEKILPVGRFAPSPTGDLHMGSLMAAVASYLSVKSRGGKWLLRIEDLDPPREIPGAAERIVADVARFGFEWDGPIVWQSQRHARYAEVLAYLQEQGRVYPCACSRSEVAAGGLRGVDGPIYPGYCRGGVQKKVDRTAWRLRVGNEEISFKDGIQGPLAQHLGDELGDFVLRRADGCWAYQLAVVVDDADFGITQVLRGADLLDSTPRQIYLQRQLGFAVPEYIHIPVIANLAGEKLSKQTLAPALRQGNEVEQLLGALSLLWQNPPPALRFATLFEVWAWALASWDLTRFPACRSVKVEIKDCFEYKICNTVR